VPNQFARGAGSEAVMVGGVAVHAPVTRPQAGLLAGAELLADRPDTLLVAWDRMADTWATTVARALDLPSEQLDTRVDGEWSFLETLRHLVFVTDGWINRIVEDAPSPHHPLGVPPHFVDGRKLGLDLDARPPADEVLAARAERQGQARSTIAATTPATLQEARGGQFTVLGAIQVVMFEEWAHHRYATRDLARLG
jgi:DinB superfamily